jgi:hypothetical protein
LFFRTNQFPCEKITTKNTATAEIHIRDHEGLLRIFLRRSSCLPTCRFSPTHSDVDAIRQCRPPLGTP